MSSSGGGFTIDPEALNRAADKLHGHAGEIEGHGRALGAKTGGRVGHGAIGEVAEGLVKRGVRAASEGVSKAIADFHRGTAEGLKRVATQTREADARAAKSFKDLEQSTRVRAPHPTGSPARAGKAGLRHEANDTLSRTGSDVHPNVPPYPGKGPTKGVFRANGTEVPLVSGTNGPGAWLKPADRLPGGPGSGKNATILAHVEGHAAGIMHKHGLTDVDLFINQAPCATSGQCRFNLHKIIPPGSTLRVHFPADGGVKIWSFRHGVPMWTEI